MSRFKRKTGGGIKFDIDKARMDLLDPLALVELSNVLTAGAKKYAAHNWRNGINVSRLVAAAYRHLTALNSGETLDPETGLQHAAHLMCNAMFLIWTLEKRPDMDDRWVKTGTTELDKKLKEAFKAGCKWEKMLWRTNTNSVKKPKK